MSDTTQCGYVRNFSRSADAFPRVDNPSQLKPLIVFIKVLSMLLHGSPGVAR